ncbi:MAG: family 43 glycosylhydrolase, partial [Clostridia bacterium]|nr:family 43 glycosylhydrolase [Clostridia bacterium]
TVELNTPRRVAFPDSPQTNEEEFTGGMSVLRVDGKTYITFVSEQGRGTSDFHQTINICEMENPWTMKGVPTVICEPEYDWEKGGAGYSATLDSWYPQVVEGASAVYSDTGDVYLMYTGSGYWTVYYQLGYMKLTGSDPLLRSSWTKNPSSIFSLSDEINGCGHASYFKDHNGDYWACYHAYTGKDTSSKRSSFVERIYVTSDGVSIGNGSGHPAPIDTVYTLSLNPKPLCEKISGFGLIEEMSEHQRLYTIIYTPEELMELMNSPDMWNAVYILGADIDLSLYQGQYGQAPIGSLSVSFTGVFDGRGYSIRGLDITSDGAVGLFGRIGGSAVVRNLSVYGIVKNTYGAASAESTDESGNYISTGGVVGSLAGGTVKDVVSRVNVYGNGNTGGVVGIVDAADDSSLVVEGCISYAEIYNTLGNTGGVIGRIRARGSGEIRISSCINYSDVSVTSSDRCRAAGIVGYTRTESQSVIIEKCANYGDISGINRQTATNHIPHVGGIAGRIEITIGADAGVVIRECKNEGSVKSSVRAGGIVGILTRSEPCTAESGIYLCENRGSVTGEFYSSTVQIGGIAGYVDNNCDAVNFRINDCANYAGISCEGGKCYAGGIIGGQDASDLYSCVNYGSVSGHSSGYAGAFTGVQVNDGAYVTENCYALEGSAGALSGYFREAFCTMKNNSFVTGQNMTALSAYPALDFDGVWVMRDEGAVLLVYAPALAGDADGDAWLTSSDITILIRYLSGWSVDEDVSVCDMNSDGIINNRDAIAMIRVLALIVK